MDEIKVGDWILIKSNRFTDLTKVAKVTSKQFVTVQGYRFWKNNNRLVGNSTEWWNMMYAEIPSQETVDKLLERREKFKLISKLSEYLETKDIPVDTLQSLVETIENLD